MKARWFVPLLVAAICWGGAFACLRALPERDTVSLRYAPSSLRPAVAQAVAGDRAFVLWQEEQQQALACPELRRQVSAKVIRTRGDAALIWASPLLGGVLPAPGDPAGCALSRSAAEALFGSSDVLGLELEYGDVRWTVRGLLDADEPLMILQDERPDAVFSALDVWTPGAPDPRDEAERFAQQCGWASPSYVRDNGLAKRLLRFALSLPLLALGIRAAVAVARQRRYWRGFPWHRMLWSMGLLFLCLGLTGLCCAALPPRFLPVTWSNAAFWHTRLAELGEGLVTLGRQPSVWACLLLAGAAAALAVVSLNSAWGTGKGTES